MTFVNALPLISGMRVLEIGCGPGVAAREIASRIGDGFVLAIDRSDKAIATAKRQSAAEIDAGRLEFRASAIEAFKLSSGDTPFDLCFAMRVGVFDGRHPEIEAEALARVKASLNPGGRFFIDTGNPLRELLCS